MKASLSERYAIDAVRGLTAILVVFYHCVQETTDMTPTGEFGYAYLAFSSHLVRVPLFAFIAGYIYAHRPVHPGGAGAFLRGKVRRILIPMLVAITLIYLMRVVVTGGEAAVPLLETWKLYVLTNAHFWFLHALLLIFILVMIVDTQRWANTFPGWFLLFVVSSVLSAYSPTQTTFLSLFGFFKILPYFIFGLGVYRFAPQLQTAWLWRASVVGALVGVVYMQYVWWNPNDNPSSYWGLPLGTVVTLASVYTLFCMRRPWPFAVLLGQYSYMIYVYHMVGMAIGKRLVGMENIHILFWTQLLLGMMIPIGIEHLARGFLLSRRLILGLRD